MVFRQGSGDAIHPCFITLRSAAGQETPYGWITFVVPDGPETIQWVLSPEDPRFTTMETVRAMTVPRDALLEIKWCGADAVVVPFDDDTGASCKIDDLLAGTIVANNEEWGRIATSDRWTLRTGMNDWGLYEVDDPENEMPTWFIDVGSPR